MHPIAKSTLVEFISHHQDAGEKMLSWYKAIKGCHAKDFNELKKSFKTADYVPEKYTILNVGGNQYRIVTVIHYNTQRLYIRHVLTHAAYDNWTKRNRRT